MKKLIYMLAAMMLAVLAVGTALAEGTVELPADRTDLTEEDFIGSWTLKRLIMEGLEVPIESLGLTGTIVVAPGRIEINGTGGSGKSFRTTFEDGFLTYMDGEEKMAVAITEDGMLHIDLAAKTFKGTAEDEGAPEMKSGGIINISNLGESLVGQYYAKDE